MHYSEIRSFLRFRKFPRVSFIWKRCKISQPTTNDHNIRQRDGKISPVVTPSIAGSLMHCNQHQRRLHLAFDTSAQNLKEMVTKTIFKKREEKRFRLADNNLKSMSPLNIFRGWQPKPTTSQPVPITISAVPATPNTQTKGAEYAPKENGLALEGNVVHLK